MSRSIRSAYFSRIARAVLTAAAGLLLTWRHFMQRTRRRVEPVSAAGYFGQAPGRVTIQYPQERLAVPDVGRYRLYMETEDCIGCDQCARICPVDCITIEKIKAVDDLGLTSDGSKKKFYLPTFDIDMAKCCYCGLCTVVCPTECITMTKTYDFAEYDRENFIYHFGNLSPEQAVARQAELEQFEQAKRTAKSAAAAPTTAPAAHA